MRGLVVEASVVALLMSAACCLRCVLYHHSDFQEEFNEKLGKEANCPSEDDVCLLVFYVMQQRSDNKLNGFRYLRNCSKSSQCDMNESITTVSNYIRYSTTCCSTDSCLPTLPVLPKVDLKKNGVACPACKSSRSKLCTPNRTMLCTGEETQCVFLNETVFQTINLHSYGCGTKNVFQEKGIIINLLSFYSTITVTETRPIEGLQPGNFLWCHVCYDQTAASCSKQRVLCEPDEDVCLSESRRIIDEQSRRLTMQIRRRCGKSPECQFSGIITSRDKTLSIKTSCCDMDMCSSPEPQWPLKKRRSNGKTCPDCFPANNSNCRETDIILCTGDETHCIHYSTTLTDV
ncbi:uncharacterized protein LOC142255770 [Anomaloglossus baeobatrachus]|uniref:uncharacterized protein LOC142255770 n=1 Tax=Anomaloglossus baeobatrachus TaxID=238106 RepID=UPI003F508724